MKITTEALLSSLPVVLAEDKDMYAMATVIAQLYAEFAGEIREVSIYPRVDKLSGELCDILAFDFAADWWEPGMTLQEKRAMFAETWAIHKHRGTKQSIERAIGAIYPGSTAYEWFDYDGEEYHFKMTIPVGTLGAGREVQQRILRLVYYFKNVRSVLDSLTYEYDPMDNDLWAYGFFHRGIEIVHLQELSMAESYDSVLQPVPVANSVETVYLPDITPEEMGEIPIYLLDELGQYLIDEAGNYLVDEHY